MKASRIIVGFLVAVLTATTTLATTSTYSKSEDGDFIFIDTPLPLTFDARQRVALRIAITETLKEMEKIAKDNPKLSTAEGLAVNTIQKVQDFNAQIDLVLESVQKLRGSSRDPSFLRLTELVPSGVIGFAGGAFTLNWGLVGGGSFIIGVVATLSKRKTIDISLNKVIRENELTWKTSLVAIPNGNIGAGIGAGPSTRLGVGLIFGEFAKPSDFKGLLAGYSGTSGKFGSAWFLFDRKFCVWPNGFGGKC